MSTTIYGNHASSNWRSYFTYSISETDADYIITIESAGINCDGGWTNFTSYNVLSITVDNVEMFREPSSGTTSISGKITQGSSKAVISNKTYTIAKTSSQQTIVITNRHTHSSDVSTATTTLTVSAGYQAPTIQNLIAYRADNNGDVSNNSTRVIVKFDVAGGSLWNMYGYTIKFKCASDSYNITRANVSSTSISYSPTTAQFNLPLNETATISVSVTVKDNQTEPVSHIITGTTYISVQGYTIDVTPNSVGFGTIAADNVVTGNFRVDFGEGTNTNDTTCNIYINNNPLVDYIIEQDTETITDTDRSGNWNYRKWASGKLEAWGSITFASVSFGNTMEGNLRRSDPESVPIPSVVNSIDIIQGTADTTSGSGYGTVWRILATASPPTMIFVKSASGASDIVCSLYLIGTWS